MTKSLGFQDLKPYLVNYLDEIAEKRKGKYICPLCGTGGKNKGTSGFTFTKGSNLTHWQCYSCNKKGGDIVDLYQLYTGKSKAESVIELEKKYLVGSVTPICKPITERSKPMTEQTDYSSFFEECRARLSECDYLTRRGISEKVQKAFGAGYCPNWTHPKANKAYPSPRIIIPTSEYSYLARDTRTELTDKQKQYSKQKVGRTHIFNVNAMYRNTDYCFVVEGEIDCMSLIECGFNALGLGSTSNIGDLLSLCRDNAPKLTVIFALDNDEAGQRAAERIKDFRAFGISCTTANISGSCKDANELLVKNRDELAENLKKAVESIENIKAEQVVSENNEPILPEPKHTQSERQSYIVEKNFEKNIVLINRLSELNPLHYHHSDRGTSELFAAAFGDKIRYNTTAKEWYVYNGKVWEIDNGAMRVHAMVKDLFDSLMYYAQSIEDEQAQTAFRNYYSKLGGKNKRDTIIKDAQDRCYISNEEFDSNPNLFNCQNGTFELDTMRFREHRAADFITKLSNVYYDEKAISNDWIKFINEVLPCDRDKVKYFQKAVGYSLSGSCSLETCFILYGATTRNGKSTAVGTISYMLGGSDGYARSSPPEVLAMKKNKDSRNASEDIARLAGCRFLNVSEPPQSMAFDAALLKTLTGRDTITARFLFQGSFEFVPQFTLFINTNYLPKVLDDTLFTSNRLNVIEFNRHFEPHEQDSGLKDRLRTRENISGLFNWCIEGLKLFRTEGLRPPMSVGISTRQYAQQSDKLGNFINECLEEEQGSACTAKEAYERYRSWCAECGYFAEGKQKFVELLRAKKLLYPTGTIDGKTAFNVVKNYILQQ